MMKKKKIIKICRFVLVIGLIMTASMLNSKFIFAKNLSTNAKISYLGTYGTVKLKLDENILSKNSIKYNKKLSSFTAALSSVMYNSDNSSKKKILKKLSFKKIKYSYDQKNNSVSFMLAQKVAKIKGKKFNVLLIALRGTENSEWQDNFNLGNGKKTHAGFNKAASLVYKKISTYIKKNKLKKSNTKIILTGHSRGGAVANILGQKILKKGIGKKKIANKNVFVYTFASPNTTMDKHAGEKMQKR